MDCLLTFCCTLVVRELQQIPSLIGLGLMSMCEGKDIIAYKLKYACFGCMYAFALVLVDCMLVLVCIWLS